MIDRGRQDFEGFPSLQDGLSSFLSKIIRSQKNDFSHITFEMVMKLSGLLTTAETIQLISYLSGPRVNLLKPQFELVDEDFVLTLSEEEVQAARTENCLINPETGRKVEDFETKIFMHFCLTEQVNVLKNSASGKTGDV